MRSRRDRSFAVELGARLRLAREAEGMTQDELASRIGRTRANVSNVELGYSCPSAHGLRDICQALGCSAGYLLGLEP